MKKRPYACHIEKIRAVNACIFNLCRTATVIERPRVRIRNAEWGINEKDPQRGESFSLMPKNGSAKMVGKIVPLAIPTGGRIEHARGSQGCRTACPAAAWLGAVLQAEPQSDAAARAHTHGRVCGGLASQLERGYTASTRPGRCGSRPAFLVLPQDGCAQRRVQMCRVTPGMARKGAPQARP